MSIPWPERKRFAFTIFDDTDRTTLQNGSPVYAFLRDLGFLTTKSVWPVKGAHTPLIGGSTCADPDYLLWVRSLQEQGFEIALHNVTYHTSTRPEILEGLERFKDLFGSYPSIHANHEACLDGMYWGDARISGPNRFVYNLLTGFKKRRLFRGHSCGSPLFWGDICRQRIKYVRNFVFRETNTLRACPYMPYFDPDRPYVTNWFASSEGATVDSFKRALAEKNIDALEEEGGACIMYTHFGKAFCQGGKVDPGFRRLMERLAQRPGWFVPVSTVLDHIIDVRGRHTLSRAERYALEARWFKSKLALGGTT